MAFSDITRFRPGGLPPAITRALAPLAVFWRHIWPALSGSGRVTHALILRESRVRGGKHSAGFAWALLVPASQLILLVAVFSLMGRVSPAGNSLPVFFLMGIIPLRLWQGMLSRGATAIRSNIGLMNYPQVRSLEVILARYVLEMFTLTIVAVLFFIVLSALFDVPLSAWMDDPLGLILALLTLAFYGLGTLVLSAQLGRLLTFWNDVTALIGRIAFWTSGVFFTMHSLPDGIRQYMALNPLAHIIEWIRAAGIQGYDSNLYDPMFPLTVGAIFLVIGLLMDWMIGISGFEDE